MSKMEALNFNRNSEDTAVEMDIDTKQGIHIDELESVDENEISEGASVEKLPKQGKHKRKKNPIDKKLLKKRLIEGGIFGIIVTAFAINNLVYTFSCGVPMDVFGGIFIGLTVVVCLLAFLPFRFPKAVDIALIATAPIMCFFLLECFTHDAWLMDSSPMILNILIQFFFFFLFIFITGRAKTGMMIATGLSFVVGFANYYVIQCRNCPILPWDIKSLSTALSVSNNYVLTLDLRAGMMVLGFIAVLVLGFHTKTRFSGKITRCVGSVISIVLVIVMMNCVQNTSFEKRFMHANYPFTQIYSYRDNGWYVTFMQNLKYMKIDKPEGYSQEKVDELLTNGASAFDAEHPATDTSKEKPNIIVIMNESFSDLAVLGEVNTDQDYMPYIHSLLEDDSVTSGQAYVSVCGGNTANSEFEYLTGCSMHFLPGGSVAYQQYVDGEIPTIASVLAEAGYDTYGMHPYNASGWDRDELYPLLGMNHTLFKNDFSAENKIRKYVSDQTAYTKIISLYNRAQKHEDTPLFFFEVTMQNHGGYSDIYDNAPLIVHLNEIENRPATENYLSLVKRSDDALKELCEFYEKQEEPTVIVFFGDHQPSDYVSNPILTNSGRMIDEEDPIDCQTRYIVPFLIWTNFENPKAEKYEYMSLEYLASLTMETAGLEMTDYQKYLYMLKEQLPVINAKGVVDSEGNHYKTGEASPYTELLNEYEMIQYNYLFDQQNGNEKHYSLTK